MSKASVWIKIVIAIVIMILLAIALKKIFCFIEPLRQVGYTAWLARVLSFFGLSLFTAAMACCFLVRKIRKQFIKNFQQLKFGKKIASLLLGLFILSLTLTTGYMAGEKIINLAKDVYYGPVIKQVQMVRVTDASEKVKTGRYSSTKVYFKKVTVFLTDGEKVDLFMRETEYDKYALELYRHSDFVYYQYSKIWHPQGETD